MFGDSNPDPNGINLEYWKSSMTLTKALFQALIRIQIREMISKNIFFQLKALYVPSVKATCTLGSQTDPRGVAKATDPDNFHHECIEALRSQVKKEFEASLQYLLMGSYFAQDDINLEGFSKLFFDHADEERTHGIKFMDFLRLRGDALSGFVPQGSQLAPLLGKVSWTDGEDALRDALDMEKIVTSSIKSLIDACDNEKFQDYYTADWLTGTWLEEQLEGQRHLAGMINTLNNFRLSHEHLADWMFSNQLLTK